MSLAQIDHKSTTIVPEENRKRLVKKRRYDDYIEGKFMNVRIVDYILHCCT